LEFDEKFKIEKGFVFYDFNKPLDLPAELKGKFDFILIDPPFITEEVWTKVINYLYSLYSTLKRLNS
jgi:16S rRNA G966 N2-methylase RsmD